MTTIAAIRAAAARLAPVVRRTPLLEADALSALAGRRVLVKAECLQHTGSFKFRGGYSAVSALDEAARARGVIAYSSGNHAQGVARAAKMLGAPAVIIMPDDAPRLKIDNTRGFGAEVVLYDRAGGERREEVGAALARDRGLALIKPYDEPLVIAGQGTAGLEIAEQAQAAGVAKADVLVCCGGGGLSSGVAVALAETAAGLRVRPCEPAGFDDVARSLSSGQISRNNSPTGSICDAILTEAPGEITFPLLQAHAGAGLVVSDDEVRAAMVAAFEHLKLVVEPGGAVALASALCRTDEIEGDAVIVIATGGNVDPTFFAQVLADHAP